jgi:hypothetical protein
MMNSCLLASWQVALTYWTGLIVLTGLALGLIAWLGDWAIADALDRLDRALP